MDKENNIVYVENKNGIFKCYKSEQMHMPIYYPIENKTNGFIDYNDVIRILNIDDLYEKVKKQKEVIDKVKKHCEIEINASNHYLRNHSSQQELCHKVAHQRILDILKEVSE